MKHVWNYIFSPARCSGCGIEQRSENQIEGCEPFISKKICEHQWSAQQSPARCIKCGAPKPVEVRDEVWRSLMARRKEIYTRPRITEPEQPSCDHRWGEQQQPVRCIWCGALKPVPLTLDQQKSTAHIWYVPGDGRPIYCTKCGVMLPDYKQAGPCEPSPEYLELMAATKTDLLYGNSIENSLDSDLKLLTRLAQACVGKLGENRHRRHWLSLTLLQLAHKLDEEVDELTSAIDDRKSPEDVWNEAADVANFAAMIADVYEQAYSAKASAGE